VRFRQVSDVEFRPSQLGDRAQPGNVVAGLRLDRLERAVQPGERDRVVERLLDLGGRRIGRSSSGDHRAIA
jgi:hypothetical protein